MKPRTQRTLGRFVRAAALCASTSMAAFGQAACIESSSRSYGSSSGATGSTGSAAGTFDKRALLSGVGQMVLAELTAFEQKAAALAAATDALATAPTDEHRLAAQDAWRDAMTVWQRLELMAIGPAAPAALPGGKDLRDGIYSWPSINRCAVDQELAKPDFASAEALGAKLINVRGLGAIEHLLFPSGATNACAASNALNTSGAWTAIAGNLAERRAGYAAAAANLVANAAVALRDAWSPDKGDFLEELSTPGAAFGGSVATAIDAVAYAFGYLDTKTKDLKLAVPAGLSGCANATCPEDLELAESAFSKRAIRENLVAYQKLFHGGAAFDDSALGFDDWLVAVGASELRNEFAATIAAALSAVDAIEEDDLAEALANDPASVEDVHLAVSHVTDLFKSQLVTVLDIHPPSNAPTDND